MKKYFLPIFIFVVGLFYFIPKDTQAWYVQCYAALEGWQVTQIGQDSQCTNGLLVDSNQDTRIVAVEWNFPAQSGHNYKNFLKLKLDTSGSITNTSSGYDIGPLGKLTNVNYSASYQTGASPSNPNLFPSNFYQRIWDIETAFTPTENITKFGYYWYFDNTPLKLGKITVLTQDFQDLSIPSDPNQSTINAIGNTGALIIQNQNANQEETNDRLDSIGGELSDINDFLTDDTPPNSEDTEDALDNITNNSDADSSLFGVVTAPFRFINHLDDACSPQSFTMFHQSFNIPCGTTLFWENANLFGNDEFIGEFPEIWNIFVGGLIIYRLVLSCFRAVQDALDPQKHDTIGVDI